MRHLRALLITTALAATACSGGSESVTDAEPDATSAPASSPPTTGAPATEAPSETEDVPWEQGQEVALVPAGIVRLPFMGGVQFELEQDRVVLQAPPSIANIHHQGDQLDEPKVALMVANETSDGEPITTVAPLAGVIMRISGGSTSWPRGPMFLSKRPGDDWYDSPLHASSASGTKTGPSPNSVVT